jgi:hypothetical protein
MLNRKFSSNKGNKIRTFFYKCKTVYNLYAFYSIIMVIIDSGDEMLLNKYSICKNIIVSSYLKNERFYDLLDISIFELHGLSFIICFKNISKKNVAYE